ncbi:MAG: hypothetical protein UR22_C0032G0003 [Parcubacteria group bacterium GW2011_GWC2_32_10]|nr:MAG: hypothetical protein UR22_C0032G0003 [Parcubacteria group bacterium GW2011_GWC2_32_10]
MALDARIQTVFLGLNPSWDEERRIEETARLVAEETQNHSVDADEVRRVLKRNGIL